MIGFLHTRGIIMTIPHIGHDKGRLAKIQAFGKTIVATVMYYHINMGYYRWLWIPGCNINVFRYIFVLLNIITYIE